MYMRTTGISQRESFSPWILGVPCLPRHSLGDGGLDIGYWLRAQPESRKCLPRTGGIKI